MILYSTLKEGPIAENHPQSVILPWLQSASVSSRQHRYGCTPSEQRTVFVTGNANKLKEVRAILGASGVEIDSQELDSECLSLLGISSTDLRLDPSLSPRGPREHSRGRYREMQTRSGAAWRALHHRRYRAMLRSPQRPARPIHQVLHEGDRARRSVFTPAFPGTWSFTVAQGLTSCSSASRRQMHGPCAHSRIARAQALNPFSSKAGRTAVLCLQGARRSSAGIQYSSPPVSIRRTCG